jgi:hypothetical protein
MNVTNEVDKEPKGPQPGPPATTGDRLGAPDDGQFAQRCSRCPGSHAERRSRGFQLARSRSAKGQSKDEWGGFRRPMSKLRPLPFQCWRWPRAVPELESGGWRKLLGRDLGNDLMSFRSPRARRLWDRKASMIAATKPEPFIPSNLAGPVVLADGRAQCLSCLPAWCFKWLRPRDQ